MRAELTTATAEIWVLIHTQAMNRKRPADAIADISINRTTNKNLTRIHAVMSYICGAAEIDRVLGNRQAVGLDVVSKIRIAHEREPRAADAERSLHRGIPRASAPCESFRWKRSPTDVAGAFPPRYPGRCPLAAGHPYPASSAQQRPAPVVVAGPAERLAGNPCPTMIRECPATTSVGSPRSIPNYRWLINITVIRCAEP